MKSRAIFTQRFCLWRPGPQAKAARLHGLHMTEKRTFTHDRRSRTTNAVKFAQPMKTILDGYRTNAQDLAISLSQNVINEFLIIEIVGDRISR